MASSSFRQGVRLVERTGFCELLTDGRATGHDFSFFQILFIGFLYPFPIKAFMIYKFGVFGSDNSVSDAWKCVNIQPICIAIQRRDCFPAKFAGDFP